MIIDKIQRTKFRGFKNIRFKLGYNFTIFQFTNIVFDGRLG